MPTRRAGANGGLVEDKLVLIGGIDETRRPHEVVDAYDVKTKSWSTLEPISEPRQGIATFVRFVLQIAKIDEIAKVLHSS